MKGKHFGKDTESDVYHLNSFSDLQFKAKSMMGTSTWIWAIVKYNAENITQIKSMVF